jgi:hypothetical protein
MWYVTCLLQADYSSNVPTKLPQDVDDDAGDDLDSALGSLAKRKRLSMHPSSRKMPPPTQCPASSGSHAPSSKASHPVLRSAFQMPTQWTRAPVMRACAFVRTVATYSFQGLDVAFTTLDDEQEMIEIAVNYDRKGDESIIGRGLSKIGIYVSEPVQSASNQLPNVGMSGTLWTP